MDVKAVGAVLVYVVIVLTSTALTGGAGLHTGERRLKYGHFSNQTLYHVPRNSPLITPRSETRSEISITFGIYKVKVKKMCPLFTSPIYRGEVNRGHIYI